MQLLLDNILLTNVYSNHNWNCSITNIICIIIKLLVETYFKYCKYYNKYLFDNDCQKIIAIKYY